ncbi:MAG: ABC transporter permease [Candidatus Bipolaricaulota bacterium]
MSLARVWKVLRKDLALGPRSPFFLYTIILPLALTVLFQFAFGALFAPAPRLALVDEGASALTATLTEVEGIELTLLDDADALRRRVEDNDFDAGLVLARGFDEAVRGAERPPLPLFVGGESHASNRFILQATVVDALRELAGNAAPAEVELVTFGEEGLPLSLRLVPVIVFYALVMAGIFVPGSSLVEEKEQGTLMAMVVTPTKAREVLMAKWALGLSFASVMSAVTLLFNQALGPRPLEVLLVIVVAAGLTAMLGLLVGVVSKDSAMLFGLIKGVGLVLFAPALFYLFPDWPRWIAMLFPLYWIIEPIWQVSVIGEPLSGVWLEVTVALVITAGLLPLIVWLARRMQAQMARQ